jgi:hypothetical protein
MTTSEQLLERLDRTFEGGVEGVVARKILSFLIEHRETTHITLQLVRQIAFERADPAADAVAVRTLQYLSAGADSVLETKFELIEDGREDLAPYILSDEEVGCVLSEGINPLSGEFDPEIKRKVVVFFAPTEYMKKLLSEHASTKGAQ